MEKLQIETAKPGRTGFLRQFASPFNRSRAFPYLWLGQLVSVLGSSITMVILPVVVYSVTGSTTIMGLIMAVYMLPNVLMLPLSGWVVDRHDRVALMMLSDIARLVIMLVIAALLFTEGLSLPWLYGLVGIYGLMDGLFQPAYAAVRAAVFTPDIRNAANALTQVSNQAVRLIGPTLGGVLVTVASAGFGFGLDALTYLISFLCLVLLRKHLPLRKEKAPSPGPSDWKKDFAEGLTVLKGHPWLWITILAFSFINICYGGVLVVLIPWLVKVHLQHDPYVYGLCVTGAGAGAIIAALIFGSRPRWTHRGLLAYGGVFLSGAALLLMAFTPSIPVLALLMALEGFGLMIFGLIWETSLQEMVPQEAFGRVVSLDMLGSYALLPLGYLLVGWLADLIGGIPTLILFASMGLLTVAAVVTVPGIRRFH